MKIKYIMFVLYFNFFFFHQVASYAQNDLKDETDILVNTRSWLFYGGNTTYSISDKKQVDEFCLNRKLLITEPNKLEMHCETQIQHAQWRIEQSGAGDTNFIISMPNSNEQRFIIRFKKEGREYFIKLTEIKNGKTDAQIYRIYKQEISDI